ncbi:MAG TPA: hypothetical protein PK987_06135 [Ferruginibacter sp.]|nr:hypothetical protein [Ferruginibacter sp.]
MKTIVILSTEPWGKMLLSKMHYAIELAKLEQKVYFVNPPVNENFSTLIQKGNMVSGVQLLYMKPLKHALFLRHKVFPLYKLIMRRYANRIRMITGGKIDELWNFNPHSFPDVKAFEASKNILLLYDFYKGRHVEFAVKQADIVFSPSQLILDYYKRFNPASHFLQHGLGASFVKFSKESLQSLTNSKQGELKKVGYTGNLLRQAIHTNLLQQIISAHPGIEFHIWGPYTKVGNNVTDINENLHTDLKQFISFLQKTTHVFLHGVTEQEALAKAMQDMDVFLFVYSANADMNAASNSHKLLEYISTGKTVVSTYVSTYKGTALLEMCKDENELPALFNQVKDNISQYNSIDKQQARISYALNNSYAAQIDKIEKLLYKK